MKVYLKNIVEMRLQMILPLSFNIECEGILPHIKQSNSQQIKWHIKSVGCALKVPH